MLNLKLLKKPQTSRWYLILFLIHNFWLKGDLLWSHNEVSDHGRFMVCSVPSRGKFEGVFQDFCVEWALLIHKSPALSPTSCLDPIPVLLGPTEAHIPGTEAVCRGPEETWKWPEAASQGSKGSTLCVSFPRLTPWDCEVLFYNGCSDLHGIRFLHCIPCGK